MVLLADVMLARAAQSIKWQKLQTTASSRRVESEAAIYFKGIVTPSSKPDVVMS
jgi:hypothetical protein